jgi:purine-binding chemotaxis protein CheW
MGPRSDDLWNALVRVGEPLATEEDYEHGYAREVRQDLQRYLAFRVSGETYGLPIAELGEITKPFETTPVPRTADFVIGIGNVRGSVIPIVDLAKRLRLPPQPLTGLARVLIVHTANEPYGLLVDQVREVVQIAPEALEAPPGAIAGARGAFIAALARHAGEIVIVLDLVTLLEPRDFVRTAPAIARARA